MIKASRQYVGGVLAGTGCGLAIATVIYKHFPGADIRDWMTIAAFILVALGGLHARSARQRERPKNRPCAK